MKSPLASLLFRSLRVYQVFGANTEVGKTVFTTLLCKSAKKLWRDDAVTFLKPVSTGLASEADDRFAHCRHVQRFAPDVSFKTLFQYGFPVSPHIAAQASGLAIPTNQFILSQCQDFAARCADQGRGWLFLETAGGVHSPAPSGTTQADLYIPLRVPVVLIGDHRLGGISQTISVFESLRIRGYDVETVLLFKDTKYENYSYLSDYFKENHGIQVSGMVEPPEKSPDPEADAQAMTKYYEERSCEPGTLDTLSLLNRRHEERISSLESMAAKAHRNIWYPFTQQKLLAPKDITVIDSAHGDYFQTLKAASDNALLRASFDGSASWWTQGIGHSNPKLTLAAAHAAGRYGHVMFASAAHAPAISLAEALLRGVPSPRLSRVFYSDNGSTGVEVALKMGLRAAKLRYGWAPGERLGVLGLKAGYHGDTIGAMDCAEPCGFNDKVEWYEGKGFWFDYPTVLCVNGRWKVSVPQELGFRNGDEFSSLRDVFDIQAREQRGEHLRYERFIAKTLEGLRKQGRRFGSLILEPVVLGAGGMALVDPLFQRALVNVVRQSPHLFSRPNTPFSSPNDEPNTWTGLPIIFDEVFTGMYRLGRFSSSSFLGVDADISVHAKLLTGGLVPLCATLASESIFDAFSSEDKTDALLHGHSYTAHPVGCQVALESVREMQRMEQHGEWDWAKAQGWVASEHDSPRKAGQAEREQSVGEVWSVWSRELVEELSEEQERVAGVWALGSVLAVHMKDAAGTGYFSNAAESLRDGLVRGDMSELTGSWNVHCRVLGNVLYIMAGQKTTGDSIDQIGALLRKGMRS